MHAAEREALILRLMGDKGFVAYKTLENELAVSPATIRRDLSRLEADGKIARIRGGAKAIDSSRAQDSTDGQDTGKVPNFHLSGTPFETSIKLNLDEKRRIGRRAAEMCVEGEGIMIDGGTTTFQMCSHLEGRNLQVLTNSLHIVNALINQKGTRLLVPAGTVFREQSIILAPAGDESMPRFSAPKLFMGAASVGSQGIMQADVLLVSAERRLMERAETVILMVDSTKFRSSSGNVVCGMEDINTLITDDGISDKTASMVEQAGVELVVV